MDDNDATYETHVRSFDHRSVANLPEYRRLRRALSDFANTAGQGTGNEDGIKLGDWLAVVRDMAITAPYADTCSACRRDAMVWPWMADVQEGRLVGAYLCESCGSAWTCTYAAGWPAIGF